MSKNIIKYIAIAILLTPMVSFAETAPASSPAQSPAPAPSTGESQSTASPATPSTSESSSTAAPATPSTSDSSSTATPATPSTGGSSSTATPATPSTGGSSSTATPETPSTGGSSSTATNSGTPTNPPTNPPTTPSNGGGSGGSSSGSSSSSSSGSRAYVYGCPMLTSYLKYGANNDPVQVAKLQSFLSNYEKMNVSVTGIFDKQTENAVTAFQTKYSTDVMGPWNKTYGTGYVYITTLKKINNIACSLPLTLSVTEQAIINEVINKSNIAKTNIIVTPNTSNSIEIKGNVDDNTTVLEIEMESESENTNVAAVSKPSVINKFWGFIKSLFQ